MNQEENNKKLHLAFLFAISFILVFSWAVSGDRLTWVLEVFPVLLGLPVILLTYKRFPLTNFIYAILIIHTIILAVGGIYTYAKTPLGFWMQDWFGFSRNHYDRIGHFAQGFFPAMVAREILLRRTPLKPGSFFSFIIVCICLAISAFYELLEFAYAVWNEESAESFLGSQGDIWDAQWDMTMALIGSMISLLLLSRIHDRFLAKLKS